MLCPCVQVRQDCYRQHLHGIAGVEKDHVSASATANWSALAISHSCTEATLPRETRLSLTIRLVPKVISKKLQSALVGRLLKR
jgi:hypothetical protein